MFWMRNRREARRQQVLDELLALDPGARRGRLEVAVTAGDVRADEVDSALRLVGRLDALRVMTIPASERLPGGVSPITGRVVAHAYRVRAAEEARAAAEVEAHGEPASPDAAHTAQTEPGPGRGSPARLATRSGSRSSRRRRRRHTEVKVGARARLVASIAADATQAPSDASAPATGNAARDEVWPSIEWLRP